MCAGALVQFRVKTLVYGAADPKAGAVDSVIDVVRQPRFNHQVEVVAGYWKRSAGRLSSASFRP